MATVKATTTAYVNIYHFIAIDQDSKQVARTRPSNGSVEIVDPDLPEGHTDLTIPSNRFSKAVCLLNQVTYVFHLT